MSRAYGDIAVEERGFADFRIEDRFLSYVPAVGAPAQKMRDRPCWPVAVENFEPQSLRRHVAGDLRKRRCRLATQQTTRPFVTVDRPANDVIAAGVAHVDDKARHKSGGVDE